MIPPQAQIEIPLLDALRALGGEAPPNKIYPLVTAKFRQLSEEDLAAGKGVRKEKGGQIPKVGKGVRKGGQIPKVGNRSFYDPADG
jgi:hypothetical protein